MKKVTCFVITVLAIWFLFEACTKETQSDTDTSKFESLRNLKSSAEMRIAFEGLSSFEKASFWKYNIKKSLAGLTRLQRKIILEIHDQISPAAYEKGSNEYILFTTLIVPKWLKMAETVFSRDKISELFYFLEGEKIVNSSSDSHRMDQVLPKYDESAPDCKCNIGSSYSCKKREVTVGTRGAEIKIAYGSCTYSSSAYICDRDDYGCGLIGMWACNGNDCAF